MRRIKLTRGKWATVDDRFYDALVAMGPWYCLQGGYAVRVRTKPNGKREMLYMHRVVMELAGINLGGMEIDYRNGRHRDNRLRNLRLATRSQNSQNVKKHKDNSSGFKGVTWRKDTRKWQAQITVNNTPINLGSFVSKRAAVMAYRAAARKHHQEFMRVA